MKLPAERYWAALRGKGASRRHEKEGLMTEALEKSMINMNSPPLSPVSVDSIKGLVRLAELLLAPADVREVIAELDKTMNDNREVVEQTNAAQRELARLRKELERERAKHEVTLDRERVEHELAMTRERAEVEVIKNAALELKAKAEADAAAAKWIKDDLMRRAKSLSAVEGS